MTARNLPADLLRGLTFDPLPQGWAPIAATMVVKCLDADGKSFWPFRRSDDMSDEEVLGVLKLRTELQRLSLLEDYTRDDDCPEAGGGPRAKTGPAAILGALAFDPLPEEWTPVAAVVLVKCLDDAGGPTWSFRSTDDMNDEEVLGVLEVRTELQRQSLIESYRLSEA